MLLLCCLLYKHKTLRCTFLSSYVYKLYKQYCTVANGLDFFTVAHKFRGKVCLGYDVNCFMLAFFHFHVFYTSMSCIYMAAI